MSFIPDSDQESTLILGGPTTSPLANDLPATETVQCPPNTIIFESDYYNGSVNWDWDYWVDWSGGGGAFVQWSGALNAYWPKNGKLPTGQPGYNSIAVKVTNWGLFYVRAARVFWNCLLTNRRDGADGEGARGATAAQAQPRLEPKGDNGKDSLRGDGGDNALIGARGDDRLSGGDGDDHLHAGRGDDALSGGDHDDLMHAAHGEDMAKGGDGNDDILTGKGNDFAHGGTGKDKLFDNQGQDHLRGGRGNDRFSAHDGARDRIDCGAGEDIAIIDRFDFTTNCEHAYRNRREAPKHPPGI